MGKGYHFLGHLEIPLTPRAGKNPMSRQALVGHQVAALPPVVQTQLCQPHRMKTP